MVERGKYERFVATESAALLDREFNRVADLMLSPKFRTLTLAQRTRALELFREITSRLDAGYKDIATLVTREMRGYALLEADVARVSATRMAAAGGGAITVPRGASLPPNYLSAVARLPIQGLSVGDWFNAQAQTMSRETRRIIQQGLVEGKSPAEITRRIVADRKASGETLSKRAKREAAMIVRTTVNAVQNDAAMAGFEALGEDVSDSYRLLVVRDSRTTTICAALADRVFRYDDPKRRVPPFHIQCRTGVQAIVKGGELGIGEQKTGPMSFRSYGDWLKTQPITTQNEILGVTRAQYWREGRMQLADVIDADNRLLTLKQLRTKLGLDAPAVK